MSLFIFNASFAASLCVDLVKSIAVADINKPVRLLWNTERTQVEEMSQKSAASRIKLQQRSIEFNTDSGAIELLKMLVHTTSYALNEKNVLYKNELSLGTPLGEGYSLNFKYESDGRAETKFNLAEIELVSPTGYTSRISKSLISKTEYTLANEEIELSADLYPLGRRISVTIPLTIEGKTLKQLDKMTSSFELFSKDELREIVGQKTISQIKRKFLIRKTQALFKKYFIAAPFKTITNLAPALVLASALGFGVAHIPKNVDVVKPATPASSWVNTSINQVAAKALSPEVKILFNELKIEAEAKIKSNLNPSPVLDTASMSAPKYKFSDQHMTWVFEQKTDVGQIKTYIVLTEEISGASPEPIKYLILEIDPIKYAELIKLIRTQGKVLSH